MSKRVLIVDDDASMCDWLVEGLAARGFAVAARPSSEEALELLAAEEFDAVVADVNMPGIKGTELCARCAENRPDIPVVLTTAFGSLETAVAGVRAGAYDFLTKPFEIEHLAIVVGRAVERRALREEVRRLRLAAGESARFEEMIGTSPAMRRVYDLLERVADTDATVLVTGETGTGKELVARTLHARGRRCKGPFVAINCAAVPEPLLESELFGHAKGAFTDAKTARPGLFVQATGGTVFLDEVGDMPVGMQVKLLRALQERAVRPVGSNGEVPFDARIVAATNRDLESDVADGRFRQDLFYRLSVINVELPPLRSRGGDVLLLAQHFLRQAATRTGRAVVDISSGAAERLLGYPWPGNVRELQNCLERAVALTRFEQITVEDLPEKIRDYRRSHVLIASDDPAELLSLEQVERRYVVRVLEAVGGNKTRAAQILGLDRRTLYRKLERYLTDSAEQRIAQGVE